VAKTIRFHTHLDTRVARLDRPTIAACEELPTDAEPGTLIYDPRKQRVRLRVEGGWITMMCSGFTPDPE
jgi:hypothetical protein